MIRPTGNSPLKHVHALSRRRKHCLLHDPLIRHRGGTLGTFLGLGVERDRACLRRVGVIAPSRCRAADSEPSSTGRAKANTFRPDPVPLLNETEITFSFHSRPM
jgi:hypothetical protein